jgi:hypothetical protein
MRRGSLVEARYARERADGAGPRADDNGGARVRVLVSGLVCEADPEMDRVLCGTLEPGVDRQLEPVHPARRPSKPDRSMLVAEGIHRHESSREAVIEDAVVHLLDARACCRASAP